MSRGDRRPPTNADWTRLRMLLREVRIYLELNAEKWDVCVAPVLMNPKRCEVIETFVAKVRGVTQTGCGGDDKTLRPFVFAVVDLQARREVQP